MGPPTPSSTRLFIRWCAFVALAHALCTRPVGDVNIHCPRGPAYMGILATRRTIRVVDTNGVCFVAEQLVLQWLL